MSNNSLIFLNFSNLDENEIGEKIAAEEERLLNTKTDFLLINMEKTVISQKVKDKLEKLLSTADINIKGTAFYGIGRGVRSLIIQTIKHPVYVADNKEDGEDWLKSQ